MKSRDVRNLIITLIILAIGIKLITLISASSISNIPGIESVSKVVESFKGLGDLSLYGIAFLVILLIPYYFSKRSKEKKQYGE